VTELQRAIATLDQGLASLELELQDGQVVATATLEDFKTALDGVRTTVYAVVEAETPDDVHSVRQLRLRRGAQLCQNVSFGLQDGTIGDRTPGLKLLRFAVEQTLTRLDKLAEGMT
jgi:hypothetical protein